MKLVMKNKNIKLGVIGILIIAIFSLSVISMNTKEKDMITSANIGTTSNKKIGWGIKRNDKHEQPDVGSSNQKILEDNKGICLGNKEKNYVYLTFDEGYEAGYTPQLLNTLKENDVKATFFITAHYVNSQPDLVKQIIEEGHTIGNHTPKSLMSINLKSEKV